MNKTFNIYCDESTHMVHDGHPYMLLGCTSIAYTQIRMAKDAIKDIKKKHGYSDELKWTNVHEATYKVYAELIDWFFMNDMEFRAVVVDKSQIDEKREDYTFNDSTFACTTNCCITRWTWIIHITYIWISRTHAVAISWRGSEK